MKLKGDMVIELTDQNTGETETVHEMNMVTNAVNDILGINPAGIWYRASGEYDDYLMWNSGLLPVCPNMIGGILMFPKTLTEDADGVYAPSSDMPVAYASNNVNSSTNAARGSLNQTESKQLDNGYKFVWEFTPSQGNGTIAAVGLTSRQGGENAWGSADGSATPFLYARKIAIDKLDGDQQMVFFHTVEIDFEKNLLYSISYGNSTVTISKYRYPVFNIGLNEKLDDTTLTLLETEVLSCETFKFYGSYTPYGIFLDGKDGYWYGFSNQSNSSGSASVLWIKIKKDDHSFTEGSWTLPNVTLMTCGSSVYSSYPYVDECAVIRNGYLYIIAYDKQGIYKINLANSSDVSLISFGFTSACKSIGGSSNCNLYLLLVNDLIIGWDFIVDVSDRVYPVNGEARCANLATQLFQYKEYLTGFAASHGSACQKFFILTPYLATINNLGTAVVKNADKTMKITYTLTEDTEETASS